MKSDSAGDPLHLGHEQLDEDHARLAGLIEAAEGALSEEGGPERAGQILARLLEEARAHFDRERSLMERHAYPDLEAHARDHERLLEDLQGLASGAQAGRAALSASTLARARSWLGDHILGRDVPLARYRLRQPGRSG
jgi:hemerythrin-like metal-binding protein